MSPLQAYQKQSLFGGWTRVEMLLQIYDRAIASAAACQTALEQNDASAYARNLLKTHKALLAIHSGLKADDNDVAFNIARLLHFIVVAVERKDFATAEKMLSQLRDGFAAIADEANWLEEQGTIPHLPDEDSFSLST